jgi:hypothetical protein
MTYRVLALRRAEADLWHYLEWLYERSPQGAERWYEAYWQAIGRLAESPRSFPLIAEHSEVAYPVHECFFGTRQEHRYRLLFVTVGDEVRLLRIRGPGQAPVTWDDLV